MDKNMEERIIAVANYIVDNNATIIQTAEHFNMSPSSIKKYINSKDKLQSIDIELFKKVKEAQMSVIIDGQIKGGKIGSREGVCSISEEKLTYIMDEMIEKDLTLKQVEEIYGIPTSTLYDSIYDSIEKTSDLERKSKIYDMYGKHRTQNQKDKETRKYN